MLNSVYNVMFGKKDKKRENQYGWKRGVKYLTIQKKKLCKNKNIDHVKKVDLRMNCPKIYNQGKLGSCTANAIGFLYHYRELQNNYESVFMPSRLFIYYNERNMEGHIATDSGAEIHDGIHSIAKLGVCSETDWPYDISQFTKRPNAKCYTFAKDHKVSQYHALEKNVNQLKIALLMGYPIAFGFEVFESFESNKVAQSGIMTMPQETEKMLGGHAVAMVGFDDEKKHFIIRNSWGEEWGDKGYFYMPYEFIEHKDYTSDFWIIKKVFKER